MKIDETPGKRERAWHGMADDDDHFFSLGFFKNGIHALVRCLHGMGWNTTQVLLFFIGKVSPEDTPPLDEVEEGER
jgi:hypothetical protein